MKKISIIVPIYNVEDYLEVCLDSILNFQSDEIEVLLINDGSTDSSEEICLYFSNHFKNVRYIYQENQGLSEARNTGIRHAQGDYILFVDSDDFINSDVLVVLLSRIELEPDVIFLQAIKYFGVNQVEDFGEKYLRDNIFQKSPKEVLDALTQFRKFPGSAWNKLISRELILKNGLFFKKGLYSEDLEWSIRLFNVAKSFDAVDDMIYYYYRCNRSGSITNTIGFKNIQSLLYLLNTYSQYPFSEEIAKYQYIFLSYEYLVTLYLTTKLPNLDQGLINDLKRLKLILWKSQRVKYRLIYILLTCIGIKGVSKLLSYWKNRKN